MILCNSLLLHIQTKSGMLDGAGCLGPVACALKMMVGTYFVLGSDGPVMMTSLIQTCHLTLFLFHALVCWHIHFFHFCS